MHWPIELLFIARESRAHLARIDYAREIQVLAAKIENSHENNNLFAITETLVRAIAFKKL